MQKTIQWALLVLCLSGIGACSAPSDVSHSVQKPQKVTQPSTHIYTEQFQALEKSKNLARNLHQAERARQKLMEEATP